ncbi:MAG: hypothetical protein PHW01_04025 [Patescibacteria group bacterium]|nr:hypothetical protein [Patescibacteria group bacterium]
MPDFKKIAETLKEKNTRERYVIVESGEPRWVVLSMQDYEDLTRKKDAVHDQEDQIVVEEKIEEELASYQAETEQEEGMMSKGASAEIQEPEFYFEIVEEKEVPGCSDLSTTSEAKRKMEWNDIPF